MVTTAGKLSTTDKAAVTGVYSLQDGDIIAGTVKAAKEPGITEAGRDELAAMLDVA